MYRDRLHAGEELYVSLTGYLLEDPVLLALPRGGVIVAKPIAEAIRKPIEILITRKIGHPQNPEVAIGAVMPDGSAVLDDYAVKRWNISADYIEDAIQSEIAEIKRRMVLYAGSSEPPVVFGRTAILIDDGIATGYTIKAAVQWLKKQMPERIVVAAPVAPPEVVAELLAMVDDVVCPLQPEPFYGVGQFYEEFPQNTDEEILIILGTKHTLVPF